MLNSDFGEPQDHVCPTCGSANLRHTVEDQPVRFSYGPDDVLMATINVAVPVTWCDQCNDAWTDGRAVSVREDAVERRRAELRG